MDLRGLVRLALFAIRELMDASLWFRHGKVLNAKLHQKEANKEPIVGIKFKRNIRNAQNIAKLRLQK